MISVLKTLNHQSECDAVGKNSFQVIWFIIHLMTVFQCTQDTNKGSIFDLMLALNSNGSILPVCKLEPWILHIFLSSVYTVHRTNFQCPVLSLPM